MDDHEERHLKPYLEPGNILVRNRYVDLPLPWMIPTSSSSAPLAHEFDQSSFVRLKWPVDEPFFVGGGQSINEDGVDLDMFEKVMATGSAETRWRQAHPDSVGTEDDILKQFRRKIEQILHEAGVKPGEEKLKGVVHGVLMFVKKNQKENNH